MPQPFRSPELASRSDSRLLAIDVQEKLVPHIHEAARVVENCRRLLVGANLFAVPIHATEQYPNGLGSTVEPLRGLIGTPVEKRRFSSVEALGWGLSVTDDARHRVVVCGVEAHVCVQQTVFDLISLGFRCYIAADAVGSRSETDRRHALERMSAGGAIITTTESILFEWCETADAPEFKELSRLVTGRS